jgi:hypothetical protein
MLLQEFFAEEGTSRYEHTACMGEYSCISEIGRSQVVKK